MSKEVRSIQKTSSSTFTVSLMSDWVEEMSMEPGSQVSLCRLSDSVLITPTEKINEVLEATISPDALSRPHDTVVGQVHNMYVSGHDSVSVELQGSDAVRKGVREAVSDLTGMSVAVETDDEMKLRRFADENKITSENSIERMGEISALFMSGATGEAQKGLKEFSSLKRDFTRLYLAVQRTCTKSIRDPVLALELERTPVEYFHYSSCVDSLKGVVDGADRMGLIPADIPNGMGGRVKEAGTILSEVIRDGSSMVTGDADEEGIEQAKERLSEAERTISQVYEETDGTQDSLAAGKLLAFIQSSLVRAEDILDTAERASLSRRDG